MPPQKNSGNKKAKRETGISVKNRRFVSDMLSDYRKDGKIENVYIGRVTRKLGNGRVEVFYVAREIEKTFNKSGEEVEKEVYNAYEKQATIKGSFRGKGKHSVWIDVGTAVAISNNGLDMYEICAVITRDQLKDIAKEIYVDERVLVGVQDGEIKEENAIEFDNDADEKLDVNVDEI
jgi:hypothetical protein